MSFSKIVIIFFTTCIVTLGNRTDPTNHPSISPAPPGLLELRTGPSAPAARSGFSELDFGRLGRAEGVDGGV